MIPGMDSPKTSSSVRKEPAPVSFWYILTLVSLSIGTCSVTMCSNQILPITLGTFTNSTWLIGFVVSLQAMHQLWVSPYAGWKSDRIWTRIGRRKPLVLFLAPILALTVILVPHSPSLLMLVPLVFFLQMAEDAELAIMAPSIGDSIPDRQRPLATALWELVQALPIILIGRYAMKLMDPGVHEVRVPIIERTLHLVGGQHWPYTMAGVIVFVTGMLFLGVMREQYTPPRPKDRFRPFSYGREIFKLREHLLIFVVFFFQPLFVLVARVFFPLLATQTMHLKPSEYGWALSWGAITTLIVCIPMGYLFNHVRRRRAFSIAGCLLALVSLTFGLFFMKSARDLAIFFAMEAFLYKVFKLNFIPFVMEYTTPQNVGTILGFTNAVNGLVRFTTLPLAGLLVDLAGKNYRLPMWGGYLGVAVCVMALLAMRPSEKIRHLIEETSRLEETAAGMRNG